ncbi:unnamed protein product, partial [Didymodactylos carnosus]
SLPSSIQDEGNRSAYFSYILFVDLLKQMPQIKQAKEIMLNKCKDYYRRDKSELEKIELFRNTYTSVTAVSWYTRDSFVYRLVNQAFRTEDVALWYLFRFFIIDLCTQLENIYKEQIFESHLTLYCGQAHMPIKEFDNTKANIDGLISTNGFLSTSKDRENALQFVLGASDTENFKVVLYRALSKAQPLQSHYET